MRGARKIPLDESNDLSSKDPLNAAAAPSDQAEFAPRQASTPYRIFFGADGLRAGWSLLIFIALMAALLRGVGAVIKLLHVAPPGGGGQSALPPSFGFFAEFLPFIATAVATWIMSKIEKRPNSLYGLGGQRKISNFLAGLAWGIVCLSILALGLWKTGLLVFDNRLLSGAAALRYGAIWLVVFLLVGLLEEYLTRGYALFTLSRGIAGIYAWMLKSQYSKSLGFWTAAVLLSLLFGLGHVGNTGESPIGLVSAGLASLVFCLSLWRTGSLWWAIGFHTSWDWAQSFLYGVPDSGLMVQHHFLATHPAGKAILSGGSTGPEGSVFALPVLALITIIIIFTLPRTTYGETQPGLPVGSVPRFADFARRPQART
jgi:membrane protease YdiL (CAAX protease family)